MPHQYLTGRNIRKLNRSTWFLCGSVSNCAQGQRAARHRAEHVPRTASSSWILHIQRSSTCSLTRTTRNLTRCNAADSTASPPGQAAPLHKAGAALLLAPALLFGALRVILSLLDLFQTAALEAWLLLGYVVWPVEGAEDASELDTAAPDEDDELVVVFKSVHDWLWSMLTASSAFAEGLTEKQLWWEMDPWGQRLQRWLLAMPTAMLVAGGSLMRWSRLTRQLAHCGAVLSANTALSSSFGAAAAVAPVLAVCSTGLHVINTAVALAGVAQLLRQRESRGEAGSIVPTLVKMSMWLVVGRAVVEAVLGYAGERETVPVNRLLSVLEQAVLVVQPLLLALPSVLLLVGNPLLWLRPLCLVTTFLCLVFRDWP